MYTFLINLWYFLQTACTNSYSSIYKTWFSYRSGYMYLSHLLSVWHCSYQLFFTYKLPILLKRLSFSGKESLYSTGSARNSTVCSGMCPYREVNRLIQSERSTMWLRSADSISVFVHSGHLNFFRGVTCSNIFIL